MEIIDEQFSYVYILRSLKDNNLYVGYTTNIEQRLKQHKYGEVKSTKNRRPLELVYREKCFNRYEGRKREKYLKSLYGVREKRKLIENFKDKVVI